MARKNPLGTIKDVAIDTIRKPKATAEKAVGQVVDGAKGGVGLGLNVAGQVATKAAGTVTSLIPGRKAPTVHPAPDLEPAQPAAASRKSQGDPMTHPEPVKPAQATPAVVKPAKPAQAKPAQAKPVNVTKELGLDPSPVAKTAPAPREDKPLTSIDAAADVKEVDVTPADIAAVVENGAATKVPAKKAPAKKPAAKKAPAKKAAASSPGDKLPPRTP